MHSNVAFHSEASWDGSHEPACGWQVHEFLNLILKKTIMPI